MKQITYEEAMKSFTKLSLDGQKNTDVLLWFMEQHKPPSWDEIVNSWSDIGFRSYDTSDEVACLFIDYAGNEVAFEYMKNGRFNVTTGRGYALYPEMLYAINLTIRYLEAQEETNE